MTQTPSSSAVVVDTKVVTRADIATALIFDDKKRSDGLSNRERVAAVLAGFGAERIDFEEVFDYGTPFSCWDPFIVEAWRHLAILQTVYVETLYIYQWIDEDKYLHLIDYLTCVVRNLSWHIEMIFSGGSKRLYVIPDRPIY